MKTLKFCLVLGLLTWAFGAYGQTPVSNAGQLPPHLIKITSGKFGQMMGIKDYGDGDSLIGLIPVYYLEDSIMKIGAFTVVHSGNVATYADPSITNELIEDVTFSGGVYTVEDAGASWATDFDSRYYPKTYLDTVKTVWGRLATAVQDSIGRINSLALLQDSILVAYRRGGVEVWRDTIAGTGGGNGIYSGSGTLASDVTITGGNYDVNFSSIGDLTVTQTSSTGTANAISLTAGNQTSGGGVGGAISLTAGNGTSSGGAGGAITIVAGNATSSNGTGGDATISAGTATSTNGAGGTLRLNGGDKTGSAGDGGHIILQAGAGASSGTDGSLYLIKPRGSLGGGSISLDMSGLSGGNKIATFQNASGTLAYLSDISGASVNDSITAHRTDINNLQTLSGRPDGSTHLGTFSGITIPDDASIKAALQSLETGLEAAGGDGNGIYDGSGTIPSGTVATLSSSAEFTVNFSDSSPAMKISDDELITTFTSQNNAANFQVTNYGFTMVGPSGQLAIGPDEAFFNSISGDGLKYYDDYSADFVDRSLVDKAYVDNAVSGAGGGTVTSVGLTMPSGLSVSGSPVTSSGTLAVSTTLNGPLRGNGSGFTTGNTNLASEVTGILPVANGGIGLSSLGTANQLLRVNSGATALEYFTPSYLTGNQTITLSGDVTGSGATSISTTIANDAVTYAKMQNVSATNRLLGRISSGAGDTEELTGTQATTILDNFTGDSGSGGVKGLVPAPASGDAAANKFLKADGTWDAVGGSISGLTTNLVTKATSSTTIGNSLIYDNGSAVGIGTTSPQQSFQIGFPNANNWFRFDRTSTSYETAFQFTTGNPTGLPADAWFIGQRSVSPVHGLWFFDYSKFGAVGDGVAMLMEPNGNVIISPNGAISMQGGEVNKITKLTSSGTATASITDRYIEFYTATAGGNQTYNLPASPAEGRTIHFFRAELGAHSVTISGNGKNINGSSTYTGLSSLYDSKTLQYNGTEWYIKN